MGIDKLPLTGLVLAGGRASRMGGQDKGLIEVRGKPLLGHILDRLRPQIEHIIINANRNIELYSRFDHAVISDQQDGFFGPLAGMLAGLRRCSTDHLLTLPCDSPLPANDYARRMFAALKPSSTSLAVASDGVRLQPVFTLLPTTLTADLERFLASGERKIDRWFDAHSVEVVDFSDRTAMFRNINTPDELARLEQEWPNLVSAIS